MADVESRFTKENLAVLSLKLPFWAALCHSETFKFHRRLKGILQKKPELCYDTVQIHSISLTHSKKFVNVLISAPLLSFLLLILLAVSPPTTTFVGGIILF